MKHHLENVRRSRLAVIGLGVLISLIAFAPMALSRPGPGTSLALTIAGLDDADDCKQGGWMTYKVFKNQGDCVSYVVTGGRNLPSGTTVPTSTTNIASASSPPLNRRSP